MASQGIRGTVNAINIKADHGAKGDGVTDDTTAIRNAVAAAGSGGRVYLPPGNYYLPGVTNVAPLVLPNFLTLEGHGFFLGTGTPAATQLYFPNVAAGIAISCGSNVNLRNLFIEGPATGTGVSTATHIQCHSVQFDNWATGLSLTNTFYGRLWGCEFHACAIGIATAGVYNFDLYGCIWRVCPQAIVVSDRIAALNMFGGSIEGWSSAGAIIPGANSLINLNGVYFESSASGNAGIAIKNNGSQNTFVLIGNQVYLTEVSKWFDGNAQDKTTLFARGNKFIAAIGSTVTPTAYALGINATGGSVDIGPEDWFGVAKVGSVFISGGVTAGSLRTLDNTGALIETPGAASAIDLGASGAIKAQHYLGKGSGPALASSTGAGTGPTLTLISGNDLSGLIQVLTGTAPAASANVVIATYNQAFTGQPRVVIAPGNAAAAALSGTSQVVTDSANNDNAAFRITAGSAALAATTTYKWWYHVLQ